MSNESRQSIVQKLWATPAEGEDGTKGTWNMGNDEWGLWKSGVKEEEKVKDVEGEEKGKEKDDEERKEDEPTEGFALTADGPMALQL